MHFKIILFSLFSLAISGSSFAVAPTITMPPEELVERLVQCRATIQEVIAFNDKFDDSTITLNIVEAYSPWGGIAWKLEHSIAVGGVNSNIVLMNGRRSFYLRVPAEGREEIIRQLAVKLRLTAEGDGSLFDFRKQLGDRTLQLLPGEDPDSYWIGCFYDQDSIRRAQKN